MSERRLITYKEMTEEEYLAYDRASPHKNEYVGKPDYPVSDNPANHDLILASTIATLYKQTHHLNCKIFASHQKVRVPEAPGYVFPDITVVCGKAQFDEKYPDILLNPTLVVEVLAPSTIGYDLGEKFQNYRRIPSFREFITIVQNGALVQHYTAIDDEEAWHFRERSGLDAVLNLSSISCQLSLADVYEQVDFQQDISNVEGENP